ncbi:MAG: hypothetical protein O3B70_02665 [Bacteroidetes bacterium]|nr:hypothetical protein [Bacteroidota bacterium]MDA0903212.1 hypothetical protein [Bacteroidota bacterium]MDA1242229.1 hypothetical protein [Bacteroidota bacterium]
MLWNLTYADRDRWNEVYAIAGRPLPWWKRSGTSRMRLCEGPGPISALLEETSDIKWANFQRTQAGAILYFRVRLEVYGVPCAADSTSWHIHTHEGTKVLQLEHAQGTVLLELTSTPSVGTIRVLEEAFGPQSVSKVHK